MEVISPLVERLVVVGGVGNWPEGRPNCLSKGFPETWRGVLGVASKVPSNCCC